MAKGTAPYVLQQFQYDVIYLVLPRYRPNINRGTYVPATVCVPVCRGKAARKPRPAACRGPRDGRLASQGPRLAASCRGKAARAAKPHII